MNYKLKNSGFSLAETLLAVAALAVGMMFVAGVFPVGIYFTTVATERTIAAIAADEAFAKVRLYADRWGNDMLDKLVDDEIKDFNDVLEDVLPLTVEVDPKEFAYPSADISRKQYYWSALCRPVGNRNVQVTVFVSRKIGAGLKYYDTKKTAPNYGRVDWSSPADWPKPVKVKVEDTSHQDELRILDPDEKPFINDGYTIIDDETGQLYRVLERYPEDDKIILLDRDWDLGSSAEEYVWVVPPPINGGRYPCIAIYQRVIRF